MHALSPTCNKFLRVTSGMIPGELLVGSMAVKPFVSSYLIITIDGAQVHV